MKTIKELSILILMLTILSGCDYVRAALGKPTSADIESIRLAQEAEAQRVADSIARVQFVKDSIAKAVADSLAALPQVPKNYYVIIGSYMEDKSVDDCRQKLQSEGVESTVIQFRNGFKLVAVGGFAKFSEAKQKMNQIKHLSETPDEVWIHKMKE